MKHDYITHPDFPLVRPETRKEVFVLLDKYFPNITDEINVDALYMPNGDRCVLGQTIGWSNNQNMFEPYNIHERSWSFSMGTTDWKEALIQYRREKTEVQTRSPALKEIDAKIASAKAELDKLLKEKQDLEALEQEVTIKLTRRELQDLFNRKVGNVKQKILKQIA